MEQDCQLFRKYLQPKRTKRTPLLFQVLALSAQELSEPIRNKHTGAPPITAAAAIERCDDITHWRQIVQKRIQSKTRRISKVSQPQKGAYYTSPAI